MRSYKTVVGKLKSIYSAQKVSCKKRLSKGHPIERCSLDYSVDEFVSKFKNDSLYLELFSVWVESGFDRDLAPSFDRIDPNKGYSFDNGEWMYWFENESKGREQRSNGEDPITLRKVLQIDMYSGKILKEWNSIKLASKSLSITDVNISYCAKGKNGVKTAGGFHWAYKEKWAGVLPDMSNAQHRRGIEQYTKDGEFIREWKGATEASKELGIGRSSIDNNLNNKSKSAGGFVWVKI